MDLKERKDDLSHASIALREIVLNCRKAVEVFCQVQKDAFPVEVHPLDLMR